MPRSAVEASLAGVTLPSSTPADQPAPDRELPHVALSQHAHDRQGILRTDDAWLERMVAGIREDPDYMIESEPDDFESGH